MCVHVCVACVHMLVNNMCDSSYRCYCTLLQLKTFRNRVEERHTHRFQEPYYPSPQFDPTSYPTKSSPTTSESCTGMLMSKGEQPVLHMCSR